MWLANSKTVQKTLGPHVAALSRVYIFFFVLIRTMVLLFCKAFSMLQKPSALRAKSVPVREQQQNLVLELLWQWQCEILILCGAERLCQNGLKKQSIVSILRYWFQLYRTLTRRTVAVLLFSVTLAILIIPFRKEMFVSLWVSIEIRSKYYGIY